MVRAKCHLSALLWSIATWIVVFQVYHHVPSPSEGVISEKQHPQKRDVPGKVEVSRPTFRDVVTMGRNSPLMKDSDMITQNLLIAKNYTGNRAEEEAKLLRLTKLLFPSKELAMEDHSEVGYYYSSRE
jgi:hypothetical protein